MLEDSINDLLNIINKLQKEDTRIAGGILDLSDQGIEDKDLEALVAAINTKSFITHLILSKNNIRGTEALAKLAHVKILDLSHNSINCEGVGHIVKNPNLAELILDYNNIHDAGGKKLLSYTKDILSKKDDFFISAEGNHYLSKEIADEIRRLVKVKPTGKPTIYSFAMT